MCWLSELTELYPDSCIKIEVESKVSSADVEEYFVTVYIDSILIDNIKIPWYEYPNTFNSGKIFFIYDICIKEYKRRISLLLTKTKEVDCYIIGFPDNNYITHLFVDNILEYSTKTIIEKHDFSFEKELICKTLKKFYEKLQSKTISMTEEIKETTEIKESKKKKETVIWFVGYESINDTRNYLSENNIDRIITYKSKMFWYDSCLDEMTSIYINDKYFTDARTGNIIKCCNDHAFLMSNEKYEVDLKITKLKTELADLESQFSKMT